MLKITNDRFFAASKPKKSIALSTFAVVKL